MTPGTCGWQRHPLPAAGRVTSRRSSKRAAVGIAVPTAPIPDWEQDAADFHSGRAAATELDRYVRLRRG